ncbi:GTP cyclohydrolase II [Litorivicinus lipolyticus]|uniref:GTP cyclohydrolase II n=1 Tax=Litorivicinus lipolyticus TaxID=418701 RepID=UPI003B59A250
MITYVETCQLPTQFGVFEMHGFSESVNGQTKEHVVLTMGAVNTPEPVLARVHSECLTGDGLFSLRCDCGPQLEGAMAAIADAGRGALFYLRQEGRGIGLMNKIRAYHLQDGGADTVEANEALGFGADLRDYAIVEPMASHLGITQVRLLTNNPRKIDALSGMGIEVVARVPLKKGHNRHNERYLATKGDRLGHLFND